MIFKTPGKVQKFNNKFFYGRPRMSSQLSFMPACTLKYDFKVSGILLSLSVISDGRFENAIPIFSGTEPLIRLKFVFSQDGSNGNRRMIDLNIDVQGYYNKEPQIDVNFELVASSVRESVEAFCITLKR